MSSLSRFLRFALTVLLLAIVAIILDMLPGYLKPGSRLSATAQARIMKTIWKPFRHLPSCGG